MAQTTLIDTIEAFQQVKKKGASHEATCPSCHVDKALKISISKNLVKCFKCGQSGVGPIGYLTELQGMKYVEACIWLADRLNIDISQEETYTHPDHLGNNSKPIHSTDFRDAQLAASGIPEEAQQYTITTIAKDKSETTQIVSRYTAGSIDAKGQPTTGHDMLLHYIDLDGQPITYKHPVARKDVPYIRIRYAHPELHTIGGKAIRYKSPKVGGNHLWIPESIRTSFREELHIDTLVFVEGEKKADALCLAGIPAVGIAGIHNFAYSNEMPSQIERLIRGCGVSRVLFWLDSDYQDIGSDITKHADARPKTFAKAVIKFRAYFEKYQREGVNLQSYIVHGIDQAHKGADDLLISLKDTTPSLSEDLQLALLSHDGIGTHLQVHSINQKSDYQIYEIWHCHSPKAFMHHHREQLKDAGEFRIKGIRYTYDHDTKEFIIVQKILPSEQYWIPHTTKDGRPSPEFDYYNITLFLSHRGYSRYEVSPGIYRLIHTEDNIVTEVDSDAIQRYVLEFTKSIEEIDVVRMLMKGGEMYLGANKMKNLPFESPAFIKPRRDQQILCFKDTFWVITPKDIKSYKHKELPGHVWSQDIIDFSPKLIEDFITVTPPSEGSTVTVDCKEEDSDIFQYLFATSDIHWRDRRSTPTTFPDIDAGDPWEEKDQRRMDVLMASLADKIIATGLTMSRYMDPASCKAVICMDAHESETGKSEGGTGKSIWGTMFEHITSAHIIDAKAPRLTEDQFLYEGVDERTHVITFDDCRRTIDFESFLSHITRGITANSKGIPKVFVGLKRIIFTTNHSIRGEDKSYVRRQYPIGFSDYFDPERTPYKVFGHSLFTEWEDKDWNAWYNFMAHSLQAYMRLGLVSFAPDEDIQRRKRRDMIGETMLEFLETYFYEGSTFLNTRLQLLAALEAFHKQYPEQRKYIARKQLRDKLKLFCLYAGYDYNLPSNAPDKRIRNGTTNVEYFIITDSSFNLSAYETKIKTQEFGWDIDPDF